MIENMWVWGGLGLVLLALEMATGTFYILWFGIAALCLTIAMWLFPNMPYALQFIIYAVLSFGSLAIWKLNYKKNETHSRAGQAQGLEIGRTGKVIETCGPNQNGKIIFTQGLMGSKEWVAVSNETIEIGANAEVIAVEGNSLKIKAI
jgi:membrane protein implicated in regulation of membrane protease activity